VKKNILKSVSFALGVAAFGFFGYTLYSSWNQLEASNFSPQVFWLLPIFLLTVATVLSGFLWRAVVRVLTGLDAPRREALAIHFGAWVMRYVPTIGSIAYKSIWLVSKGFRLRLASLPIIFEGLFVQITSFMVGIALLAPAFVQAGSIPPVLWTVLTISLIAISILFLRSSLMGRLLRLSEDENVLSSMKTWTQLRLLTSYLLPRLITAGAAVSMGASLGAIDYIDAMALGGAFLIAAALGFLVPFVPSGLGIREGVFVALLVLLGWEISSAVTVSILLRFLTTLSDIVIAGLWFVLRGDVPTDNPPEGTEQ